MTEIKNEHSRGTFTIGDVTLLVVEQTWTDGGKSFEVFGSDENSERYACLTMDGAFDEMPTVDELRIKLDGCVIVTLEVENTYELYPDANRTFRNAPLPIPPFGSEPTDPDDQQAWDDWADEYIRDGGYVGVGHEDGDSWYDVEITESSLPSLVGETFDWGY